MCVYLQVLLKKVAHTSWGILDPRRWGERRVRAASLSHNRQLSNALLQVWAGRGRRRETKLVALYIGSSSSSLMAM